MSFNMETETIDGYEVSSDIKKLWACELEILEEVERICNKHNIRYFADFGTLLGAVRHKGFIPWDDDLDLSMLPEDYERFVKIAPKEIRPPFFCQSIETEKGFTPWHIKIRKSDTTGATEWEIANAPSWNKGIFIDILPMYPIPQNKKQFLKFKQKLIRRKRIVHLAGSTVKKNKSFIKKIIIKFIKLFDYEKLCRSFVRLCESGGLKKGQQTNMISSTSFRPDDDRFIANKKWYESTVQVDFLDRKLPAPSGYEKRLTKLYGDYMKPVKGAEVHSGLVFDVNVSYKEKLNNK